MLNLQPEEIATIGDMPNDVPMFEKGGLSIAMGQSSDEVKSAATEVTTSSEDEGFANAVEKFILKSDINHCAMTILTPNASKKSSPGTAATTPARWPTSRAS